MLPSGYGQSGIRPSCPSGYWGVEALTSSKGEPRVGFGPTTSTCLGEAYQGGALATEPPWHSRPHRPGSIFNRS